MYGVADHNELDNRYNESRAPVRTTASKCTTPHLEDEMGELMRWWSGNEGAATARPKPAGAMSQTPAQRRDSYLASSGSRPRPKLLFREPSPAAFRGHGGSFVWFDLGLHEPELVALRGDRTSNSNKSRCRAVDPAAAESRCGVEISFKLWLELAESRMPLLLPLRRASRGCLGSLEQSVWALFKLWQSALQRSGGSGLQ